MHATRFIIMNSRVVSLSLQSVIPNLGVAMDTLIDQDDGL